MTICSGSCVYLKRKILFSILLALISFPLKPIVSNSQTLYHSTVFETHAQNLMSVADIGYFQLAKVEIQGKDKGTDSTPAVEKKNYKVLSQAELDQYEESLTQDFSLPEINYRVRREVIRTVTAYNPVPEQTDSTPCITANGTDVCKEEKNVIAANWLPFGTKVQIPDYFGDKVFEVEDRMHERFSDRVDVLMYDLDEAKQFGKRNLRVIVLD